MLQKKTKNRIIPDDSAFSLIEILLSLAILFMIIGGAVIFSVRTIENHTKNQAMQNAMDNARFAIEGMSKKIRTSSDISGEDDKVFLKDNVDGSKYCYQFEDYKLKVKKYPYNDGDSDYEGIERCEDIEDSFEDLVSGNKLKVTGKFKIKETDLDNEKRGFVGILVKIDYNNAGDVAEKDSVTIQSGVSLMDY